MNTKRIAAALGAAVLVVLGSSTSAFATFDDYEAPSVDLQLNPTSVVGGNSFTATATSNEDCKNWVITFEGPTSDAPAGGSGNSAVNVFSTEEVESTVVGTVTATCTYSTFFRASTFTDSLSATAQITVNPAPDGPVDPTDPTDPVDPAPVDPPIVDGPGGDLPNTGGPNMWLAVGGAALTLVGAGAVLRSRRHA